MRLFSLKNIFLTIAFAFAFNTAAWAAEGDKKALGYWKTIDDKDKQPKSFVKIFMKNGKLTGKIIYLFRKDRDTVVCEKCSGAKKGQKVIGMEIIWGMSAKDKITWGNGKILDPKNGKEYGCSLWVDEKDPSRLNVRGWVFVFNRTQTWHRASDAEVNKALATLKK